MASDSYARAPGTSSISNGARNITRRIEAIARFKLYPRGMALVSVCTVLILASALLTGVKAEPMGRDNPGTPAEALARHDRRARLPLRERPGRHRLLRQGRAAGDTSMPWLRFRPRKNTVKSTTPSVRASRTAGPPPDAGFGYRQIVLSPRLAADGVWRASVAVDESVISMIAVDDELKGEAEEAHDRMYLIPLEISEENGRIRRARRRGRWIYASELDSEAISTPEIVAADNPEAVAPAYTASAETPAGTLSLSAGSSADIALLTTTATTIAGSSA